MKKSLYTSEPLDSDEEDDESGTTNEKSNPYMPHLGTRVKRGPDWKWKNQDWHGPGTVIGYSKKGIRPTKSIANITSFTLIS